MMTTLAANGVTYTPIGTLSGAELTDLFASQLPAYIDRDPETNLKLLTPPTLTRGVSLYRVCYTIEIEHPTLPSQQVVSGLLMVPDPLPEGNPADGTTPLAIYNHGTLFNAQQAASNVVFKEDKEGDTWQVGSAETLFNLALLAEQGYAMLAADYVGFGVNTIEEGYGIKEPCSTAIVGLLEASRSVLADLGVKPGQLFVNGWSQGAANTQWSLQKLESLQIPVAAAAAESPFNNPLATTLGWLELQMKDPRDLLDPGPWVPLCLAMLLSSYESWRGLNGLFDAIIKDEVIPDGIGSDGQEISNPLAVTYREVLRRFADFGDAVVTFGPPSVFSNDRWEVEVIRDGAPVWTTIPGFAGQDLLVPGALDQPEGVVQEFLKQLEADSPLGWTYQTPLKAWYGLEDEALPPELVAPGMAEAGGPNVTLVPVEGASHRLTFINALLSSPEMPAGTDQNLIDWFNGFRKQAAAPAALQLADNTLQVVSDDFGLLPVLLEATQQQGERPLHIQILRLRNDGSSEIIGSLGGTTAVAGQLQSLGSERVLLQVGERLGFQLLSRSGNAIDTSTTEIRAREGGAGFEVTLRDGSGPQAASLQFRVDAAPQQFTPSLLDRLAAPQAAAADGLLQLRAGQVLNLAITSDSAFTNTLGFVRLNRDPITGLPLSSVGEQAIDINSDTFRSQIDSLLDPGFQFSQGGRTISSTLEWTVAQDGIYAAVLITPEGNVFCAAPGSSDQQMRRLGQNRLGFEDLKGTVSDYDWNDLVVDITGVSIGLG